MTSLDLFEKGLKNGIIGNEAKKNGNFTDLWQNAKRGAISSIREIDGIWP
jgi:hypothetical protein